MPGRCKIILVVSTRPNYMKVAPILPLLKESADLFQPLLVHTGQHYDVQMSDVFFRDLGLPEPDRHLGVGSGRHGEQTARALVAFEEVLLEEDPDLVVVVGDVNATLACALDAAKLCIPVAHVEAGLRSRDRRMPEELNRLLTDVLSTFLFTPSPDADSNLLGEGIDPERIHLVGNVMIDSLRRLEPAAVRCDVVRRLGLTEGEYGLLTLHRPSNVDDPAVFGGILDAIGRIQEDLPIVFPLHPRTRARAAQFDLEGAFAGMANVVSTDPVSYVESLKLQMSARLVMTDSGGIQEETTAFGVPCLTLRENTERPVTVEVGTNVLVGVDPSDIVKGATEVLEGLHKRGRLPDLWDGRAAVRIVETLRDHLRTGSV